MKIKKFFLEDEVVFKASNVTLTIKYNVISDAKFYGYDLLDDQFISSFFVNR